MTEKLVDLYKVLQNTMDWKDTFLLFREAYLEDNTNWVHGIDFGKFVNLDRAATPDRFENWEVRLRIENPANPDRTRAKTLTHDVFVEGLYRAVASDEDPEMRGSLIVAMVFPEEFRDEVGDENVAAVVQFALFNELPY